MVLRMVLPSAAMRPGNDLSAADCADCWMNGMPTITMMCAAKNSTTPRVNTDGKEQRTTATPDSPRLGR
ncbi:hypothetical protein LIQ43_09170 [Bifidobacterium breve]|nr:hypothetical protein [Bifidobacterium breve]MCB5613453.1 hypothetical protein [Bifidobacterium breve]MCB5677643.1 hypothetical protein [Bifidobacterium breve]MCB8548652.1 hypothetical protein [Bifidobacterium sp. MSK23_125]MCB8555332.1 hypothetical protein [Bifidobacterium sp. MSK23_139]